MKPLFPLTYLILSLFLLSCSAALEIEGYIDLSAPFKLSVNTTNEQTGLTEQTTSSLEVDSENWKKLVEWGNANKEGWRSSPASYIGDVYVSQGDFRLIHSRGSKGVVIAFTDKEGNPKQYSKGIEKGELDFLFGE